MAFKKFDPSRTPTVSTCLSKRHTVLAGGVVVSTGSEDVTLSVLGHSHTKRVRLARQARELVFTFSAFLDFFTYREKHEQLFL